MKGIEKLFNFEYHFFKLASENGEALLKKSKLQKKKENEKKSKGVVQSEITSGKDFPIAIQTDFGVLIGEIHALNRVKETVEDLISEIQKDFNNLLDSRSFDEFIGNFNKFVDVETLKKLPDVVRDVIQMQAGLVLSFGAVFQNLSDLDFEQYGDSFNQYFFSKKGYETVSGDLVLRPKLPKLPDLEKLDLKSIGNQINAERYLRDLIRIIVETTGDGLYKTRDRYQQLREKYGREEEKKKLVEWFDSFGDMVEASLLPVVEEVLNGALGVELNPLIAAAVGTFCSVTARKATEHSYLTLLEIA